MERRWWCTLVKISCRGPWSEYNRKDQLRCNLNQEQYSIQCPFCASSAFMERRHSECASLYSWPSWFSEWGTSAIVRNGTLTSKSHFMAAKAPSLTASRENWRQHVAIPPVRVNISKYNFARCIGKNKNRTKRDFRPNSPFQCQLATGKAPGPGSNSIKTEVDKSDWTELNWTEVVKGPSFGLPFSRLTGFNKEKLVYLDS